MIKAVFIFFLAFVSPLQAMEQDLPTCSDLVARQADSDSPHYFVWSDFSREWKRSLRHGFDFATSLGSGGMRSALRGAYRQAFLSGDRRLDSMKNAGFQFALVNNEIEIHIPELGQLVKLLRRRRTEWIAARPKLLSSFDTLDPGVMVLDEFGKYRVLRYGIELARSVHVDVSNRPDLLGKMIELGVFPILANSRAHHDLFHILGIFESPEYMGGLRRLGVQYGLKKNLLPIRDRYVRYFYVYEAIGMMEPDDRPELERLASYPFSVSKFDSRVEEVAAFLATLPEAEVVDEAEKVLLFSWQKLRNWGAAAEIGVNYTNTELRGSFPVIQRELSRILDAIPRSGPGARRRLCRPLAQIESALWYSSFISMDDIFQAVASPDPLSGSPFYRMMVDSGLSQSFGRPESLSESLLGLSLQRRLLKEHEPELGEQFRAVSRP